MQAPKLPMDAGACDCIRSCGGFRGGKPPNTLGSPMDLYRRYPLSAAIIPRNPLKSGCVSNANAPVLIVLRPCSQSQIISPIVHPVAVFMINLKIAAIHYPQDETVQKNRASLAVEAVGSYGIRGVAFYRCDPVEPSHYRHIGGVDDCLIAPRERHVGDIAFNADLTYSFRHLAASIASMGRLIAANDPGPPFMTRPAIVGNRVAA